MLALAGLAADAADGEGRIVQALESGAAAERFGQMVAAQGGPTDFVERWPDRLPSAPVVMEVPSLDDGYVWAIDGEALGHAVVHLGGGRLREGDRVNPSVGLSDLAGLARKPAPACRWPWCMPPPRMRRRPRSRRCRRPIASAPRPPRNLTLC